MMTSPATFGVGMVLLVGALLVILFVVL
ncbi:hypothetical protein AHiyo6_07860, partial [Arthrobacter sp. Hiyo6]